MSDGWKCGRLVGTSVSVVCGGYIVVVYDSGVWYHECKKCGSTFPERAASRGTTTEGSEAL